MTTTTDTPGGEESRSLDFIRTIVADDVRDGKHLCLEFPTNTLIASHTWMPSICLPAGFSEEGLPVGMELVVLPFHEPELFRLGYGFEQATKFRRAPTFKE